MTEPYLTVDWQPLLNAGFPVPDPTAGSTPAMAVGWEPKLGTSWYAYGDHLTEEADPR
ncbi:hypothetical protein [Micromonospora rosaria]|uniref:hypothetical protein n=1 Tax=Micromonospora rosaria TaxID=47874 RepID=UPI000A86CD5C|nr:hypothetical protein [Micromonospora rosaria]